MHVTIPYCDHGVGFATHYVHAWDPHLELAPIGNCKCFQGLGSFIRFSRWKRRMRYLMATPGA